jgi:uroporphyrinogen-III decarboxylase
MNSRERTLAAIHGIPDKIPFNPFIMHLAAELSNIDYCHEYVPNPEKIAAAQIKCANFFGIDHLNVSTDAFRTAAAWGVEIFWDGNTPDGKTFLTLDEFDSIETPDLLASPRVMNRVKAVELMKKKTRGTQCIVGWVEAPFAEINCLFGVMAIMQLPRKNWSAKVKSLMDRVVPVLYEFAMLQIEAGADIIGFGDSMVSQIGPKKYLSGCLEKTQQLFASVKKHLPVLYHTCGDNSGIDREGNDMLQLIASTGCDILDIDYQIDLTTAKNKVGDKVCLRGNSNTQILGSDKYSSNEVVEEVARNIRAGKIGGKYMYAAGCELPWFPKDLAIRNLSISKALNEKMGKYL